MIKNERQYLITKKQADAFRTALATARAAPAAATANDRQKRAWEISGLEAQLSDLDTELRLYEDLQHADGTRVLRVGLQHLAGLLIQGRIARGWTQRQLAERLGLQMQKIQQYEKTDYAGASLTRLLEVCQALGLRGTIEAQLVDLPASLDAPPAGEPDVSAFQESLRRSLDQVVGKTVIGRVKRAAAPAASKPYPPLKARQVRAAAPRTPYGRRKA